MTSATSPPQRLLGVNPATREHQLVRARGADQPRQQPARAHVAVGHANVDEGHAEHRLPARVADVGREREREPEARRRPVDGGDHRLRQGAELKDQRGHVLLVCEPIARLVAAVVCGRCSVPVQVEAGAEPPAGAGEDERATRALDGRPAQLLVQLLAQLGGHRIEMLRSVERDPAHVRSRLVD
ncbi:MAG TPA: hypothetical protein VNY35_03000 [Solirubrobacteraceae bacterium]|nr:hypothetical protein [Solirubrobacteraceae bacterium]